MQLVNPTTEEVTEITETPRNAIPGIVQAAHLAQGKWAQRGVEQRVEALNGIVAGLEHGKEELGRLVARDMGKPLARAISEVETARAEAQYLLEHALDWLADEEAPEGYISYAPMGVAAVISPWNFPVMLPLRSILPALIAGNSVVFKPSECSINTGIAIYELLQKHCTLPSDVLQIVVGAKEHGKDIVAEAPALVSFTGSTAVGKHIMAECANTLTRVLLELGGLDAAIVLKDADPAETAKKIVQNNCNNSGQVCCAIKRVFVEKELYNDFVQHAVDVSKSMRVGDPETDVDMGPLVAGFQLDKVSSFVEDARKKGASVLTGGAALEQTGYFYPSTVITDLTMDARLLQEEPFGPVLPIMPIESWEEGVALANATPYGLAGSVWGKDPELTKKVAESLDVGVASINNHGSGGLGMPWGGAKQSGIGRMKTKEGLREYTNIKLVRVFQA